MKGHATLVQACEILGQRGCEFRCQIIGAGPEERTLRRLVAELGLEDRVSLLGARSLREVYERLASADVFVHLSQIGEDGYRDGFPNVILEAMATGLPVVSTWVSGIPECVLDGKTGYLVHERDPLASAEAIEKLLRDTNLRSRLGAAGRQRLEQNFQLDGMVDELEKLLSTHSRPARGH